MNHQNLKALSIIKATLLVNFMVWITFNARGQALEWGYGYGGTGSDRTNILTIDDEENVYAAGYFSGTVDFDPGAGVANYTVSGNNDLFVLKLDKDRNFIWAITFVSSNGYAEPIAMDVDTIGNVYITGKFAGTVDFDPGPGTVTLNAPFTSGGTPFIAKLNPDGSLAWAKKMDGSLRVLGLAASITGSVYISGRYSGTVDFDPGTSAFNLSSNGGSDAFVFKLNTNGVFRWAVSIGGSNNESSESIAMTPDGNIVHTGYFSDTVDFDPETGVHLINSNTSEDDFFVQKLDTTGSELWTIGTGGPGSDHPNDIEVDAAGNIHTIGFFQDTVDFDPGTGVHLINGNNEYNDFLFVQKLDAAGNFLWAGAIMGSSSLNNIYAFTLDQKSNVYITGKFFNNGAVDFDPGPGIDTLSFDNSYPTFICKWDASGNHKWVIPISFYISSMDAFHSLYVGGTFSGTVDIDLDTTVFNITSNGSDGFHLKMDPCQLSIDTVDVSVVTSGATFSAVNANATYQWVDCDNNFAVISGETDQNFTATTNGSYAVIVTENNDCSNTSECIDISNVSVGEAISEKDLKIYPNPASERITIQTNGTVIRAIIIRNVAGQIIQQKSNPGNIIDISALPSGTYCIEVFTAKRKTVERFIKQ